MLFVFAQAMGVSCGAIIVFYSFVGGIILIVMSALAGAALRSTKSQVKTHITDSAEICARPAKRLSHSIC